MWFFLPRLIHLLVSFIFIFICHMLFLSLSHHLDLMSLNSLFGKIQPCKRFSFSNFRIFWCLLFLINFNSLMMIFSVARAWKFILLYGQTILFWLTSWVFLWFDTKRTLEPGLGWQKYWTTEHFCFFSEPTNKLDSYNLWGIGDDYHQLEL